MAIFVLIHGMWHGGWCWKKVTSLLRAAGYDVYTPTLTGLGERSHLSCDNIDLNMHIQDIVNLIEYEDLRDVILVGHSSGGFMVPLIADKVPKRVAHIVNLDGIIPESGKALKDLIGDTWELFKKSAMENGNERWLPPIAEWTFGISGIDLEWMKSKLTPHPLKTLETVVSFENLGAESIPRVFISCTEGLSAEEIVAEEKKYTGLGWKYHSLSTGHDAMVTVPDELTNMLLKIAKAAQ